MPTDLVASTRDAIRDVWSQRPRCGVILGTGLGGVVERMEQQAVFNYGEFAEWPRCTAPGHAGRLVCGTLAGTPTVVVDGRFHLYEGHTPDDLILPVRLLAVLGVETLVVSNAAGGLNPHLTPGDLVIIADHINLLGRRGFVSSRSFSSRESPYDQALRERALAIARREAIPASTGTYVAVAGPNYETRAEYRFLRRIGGDVVGMSTVPEVLAAAEFGLRTLALSVVTNVARPDAPRETSSDEVVAAAHEAAPRLCRLVESVVAECNHG